jgi:hypothetical protein
VRRVPVERVPDVLGNLVYGTMFTNHFLTQRQSVDDQAADILDVVFTGLLTPGARRRWQARMQHGKGRSK